MVLFAVFFSHSGWFAAAYVCGEVGKPQRNLPLVLILGTLCVTMIGLLLNLAYFIVDGRS